MKVTVFNDYKAMVKYRCVSLEKAAAATYFNISGQFKDMLKVKIFHTAQSALEGCNSVPFIAGHYGKLYG